MGIRSLTITSSNALNIRLRLGRGARILAGRGWSRWRSERGGRFAGPTRVPLFHHHEHRFRLLRGEQAVNDERDAPLVRPAPFVLAAAVLKVEHRIPHVAIGVVTGRSVDEDAPPGLGRLGEVPALADLTVGHILGEIVVDTLFGNLDPAGLLASSVEHFAAGVVDLRAVDENPVVVEPRHLRFRGRGPEAIIALLRGILVAVKEPEDDLLGVGCFDAEGNAGVVVDPGILHASNVAGGGNAVGGVRILGRAASGWEEDHQAAVPQFVH